MRRIAAWYLTGPVGHLVAGVLDWAGLLRPLAVVAAARPVVVGLRRRRSPRRSKRSAGDTTRHCAPFAWGRNVLASNSPSSSSLAPDWLGVALAHDG